MSQRGARIDDLIRSELAGLLQREVKDPRVKLATVAAVSTTRDLSLATVQVSVLGDEEERRACIAALRHASGFLRRQLASRLRLRHTPELVFELFRGAEHSQRISDLLETLDDGDTGT